MTNGRRVAAKAPISSAPGDADTDAESSSGKEGESTHNPKSKNRWSSSQEETLVSIYSDFYIRLENNNNYHDRNEIWRRIAKRYHDVHPTPRRTDCSIRNKWHHLWTKYRKVRLHNTTTGNAFEEWKHYEAILAFSQGNPSVEPAYTIDSLGNSGGTLQNQLEEADFEGEPSDDATETDEGDFEAAAGRKRPPKADTTNSTKTSRAKKTKLDQLTTSLDKYVDYFIKKDKERMEERKKAREEDVQLRRELLATIRALCDQNK